MVLLDEFVGTNLSGVGELQISNLIRSKISHVSDWQHNRNACPSSPYSPVWLSLYMKSVLEDGRIQEHGDREDLAGDPTSRFFSLLRTGMGEVLA